MNNRFSLKRKLHYTQSKRTTYPIDFISDISARIKLSADALSVSLALVSFSWLIFTFSFCHFRNLARSQQRSLRRVCNAILFPRNSVLLLLTPWGPVARLARHVMRCHNLLWRLVFLANLQSSRLQAVPFWIVERSREIAEREKKNRANERKGAWGEAEKRGEEKKGTALLAVTDAFRVTPPTIR